LQTVWSFAEQGAAIRGGAAVDQDHVVLAARNRNVVCLNPANGETQWTRSLKSGIESSPVIVGNRVFVGCTDGRLYTLDLANGSTLWERQFNGGFIGSPAVAFGRLVIATKRGVVYCLGEKT
jgi:outer membrane protein assembly factor BamB